MGCNLSREAAKLASGMGYPVVLKIVSPDITHKSEVNGVRLGLSSGQAVRSAFGEMLADIRRLRPDAALDGIVIEPMVARPHAREVLLGMTFLNRVDMRQDGTTMVLRAK